MYLMISVVSNIPMDFNMAYFHHKIFQSSSWYLDKLSHHFIKITSCLIPRDSAIPLDDNTILTALTLLRVLAAFRGFINYK